MVQEQSLHLLHESLILVQLVNDEMVVVVYEYERESDELDHCDIDEVVRDEVLK